MNENNGERTILRFAVKDGAEMAWVTRDDYRIVIHAICILLITMTDVYHRDIFHIYRDVRGCYKDDISVKSPATAIVIKALSGRLSIEVRGRYDDVLPATVRLIKKVPREHVLRAPLFDLWAMIVRYGIYRRIGSS